MSYAQGSLSELHETHSSHTHELSNAVWLYMVSIKSIQKRDGTTEDFLPEKLLTSLRKTFEAASIKNEALLEKAGEFAITRLQRAFNGIKTPTADEVREIVSLTLIDMNLAHAAQKYLSYRAQNHKPQEPVYGKGNTYDRFFSHVGVHPYQEITWEKRDAIITNDKGAVVFEQKNVEVPSFYSQTATNIVVSKYFRGKLGTTERETSIQQMIDRVAKTIAQWGRGGGYFHTTQDADIFEAELTAILVNQRAAFNSPVWFNVGIHPRPQCSACFINSVQDDMRSILHLAVTEGMLFKYGSGTGSNLSGLRSSRENLSQSSGKSSGPVSFMKGFDAFAGVIKSGGKTRRAAKMVILDVEHPDIMEFIWCKAKEEKKAQALIDIGYDGDINGEAYSSIFFQNANNSVRVTDDFMRAAEENREWWTKMVTSKEPCECLRAREVLRQTAQAAWECGDPGLQYDTTVNAWNTCANTDRIYASNPCSEYMFLNDTACNLSSINLMRCRKSNGDFDIEAFRHCAKIMITAQEIVVDYSSYPTPAIEYTSYEYRSLGLGFANLGSLLMSLGLPYDSEEGRNIAAAITSVMSGVAYEHSARMAEKLGPFRAYKKNASSMLAVIRKHRDAAYAISSIGVAQDLLQEARISWDRALALGEQFGYRNAQISLLAPTGTISFLMDCATTGIEPDIALVKYKWLVGGGMLKMVNDTVPEALRRLEYDQAKVDDILHYLHQQDTIEEAPHLEEKHLPIFDCAFKAAKGSRSIHYRGHIRMMAAVQPFLSGAISKTVNMPEQATVEDVMDVYIEAWKLGLKAVAIYRDGCKRAQPLTMTKQEVADKKEQKSDVTIVREVSLPRRRRLSDERRAITHKFQVGVHEGYITVGLYDDGQPGEIFITMNKEGTVISGLMDSFATSVSVGLQYGVPLKVLVNKFAHVRFEPSGFTKNPHIRMAKSIVDYIFRWLALKFLPYDECRSLGIQMDDLDQGQGSSEEKNEVAPYTRIEQTRSKQSSLLNFEGPHSSTNTLISSFNNQADAPACDTCGTIMVRNASCYKCLNCGTTSGCS